MNRNEKYVLNYHAEGRTERDATGEEVSEDNSLSQ